MKHAGKPIDHQHLGQRGFYLLSLTLNGKFQHRCRRSWQTRSSPHQPLPWRGHSRANEPCLGEIKFGSNLLLRIYHELHSTMRQTNDLWPLPSGVHCLAGGRQKIEHPTITRNTERKEVTGLEDRKKAPKGYGYSFLWEVELNPTLL